MAWSYLVHLVCGTVLTDSDRNGRLVWQGYPQFYICHAIVVLQREAKHNENFSNAAFTPVDYQECVMV